MAQATLQTSLVGELEVNVEIKAPAKKFYHMLVASPKDIPNATPDIVQRCGVQEGEFGKVGSIIFWNYAIDGQPKFAKEKIEAVDSEKNLIVFKVIEGDLMKEFKSFLITVQVTSRQSGSVVKCHMNYERIDEKVAGPDDLLAAFVKMFKDMDQMLLSQV